MDIFSFSGARCPPSIGKVLGTYETFDNGSEFAGDFARLCNDHMICRQFSDVGTVDMMEALNAFFALDAMQTAATENPRVLLPDANIPEMTSSLWDESCLEQPMHVSEPVLQRQRTLLVHIKCSSDMPHRLSCYLS